MSQRFAVCTQKCKIIDINKQVNSKDGFLTAGQLVKILDEIRNETCVISVCITNQKNYSFTPDFYHCPKTNLCPIPAILWQILLPVKIGHRTTIVKNGMDYLLNLQVGNEVQVSGGSIKIPGILTCFVRYMGEIPQKGNGYFFGLELIQNTNSIPKEFQFTNLKQYNMGSYSIEKCFIATAELLILPNTNTQNNNINLEPRDNLSWRALPVTREHVAAIKTDKLKMPDPELEKKAKKIRELKEYLKSINSPENIPSSSNTEISQPLPTPSLIDSNVSIMNQSPNTTAVDKMIAIKALQEKLAQLDVNSSDFNDNQSSANGKTLQKNKSIHVFNEITEMNPLEKLPIYKNPIETIPRESRMIFLSFSKDLIDIRKLNNFPSNDDDISLIYSIELELALLKKQYTDKVTNNDNKNEDKNVKKLPPVPPRKPTPKPAENKFKCQKCVQTYMNIAKVKVDKCQHQFCKNCFIQIVNETKTALRCPYFHKEEQCKQMVQENLIKENVSVEDFKTYFMKIRWDTIGNEPNGFRCKTIGCYGCWIADKPNVTIYECPVCKINNCRKCEAIHNGINCKEYERTIIYGPDKEARAKIYNTLTVEERLIHGLVHDKFVRTDKQAENAIKLIEKFPLLCKEDIYWSVMQTDFIEDSEKFLHQECQICFGIFSRNNMENMIYCADYCCRTCATEHFTERITSHSIINCVCPFCMLPKLENMEEQEISNYFILLDPLLRRILSSDIYEVFQNKVRDRGLSRDPNFKWCNGCSSGYIIQPHQKAVTCPTCHTVTCASCRKPWEEQHLELSCEAFADWQTQNNPENQAEGLNAYLELNGIQCPQPLCKQKYALAKGGCIHFRCTQCKHEFCCGCNQPMSNKCTKCSSQGLHAHHPRNCLYYLREYSVKELQDLLTKNNIEFLQIDEGAGSATCSIPIQNDDLKDDVCGKEVVPNHRGLCVKHYIEYLVDLINKSNVDPVTIMEVISCQQELIRNQITSNETDLQVLRDTILKNIPLTRINVGVNTQTTTTADPVI